MAKLSEILAEIKTMEAELIRAIDVRDEIIQKRLTFKSWETEKKSAKTLEAEQRKFKEDIKKRLKQMTEKINKSREQLFKLKHAVNQKNLEVELDTKILEIKWARVELSKLMKHITRKSIYSSLETDSDYLDEIGVLDMIKDLETKKKKIDAEIQGINHSTNIVI